MKTFTLLVLITVYILPLTAQNWEPFSLNRTSYFAHLNESPTKVHQQTQFRQEGIFGYFHQSDCPFWHAFVSDGDLIYDYANVYQDQFLFALSNDENIDYVYLNQTGDGLSIFTFKPNAKPGDTWDTHPVTVKCVAEDTLTILGQLDSVRIFHILTPPYDTSKVILSKAHGLIRYPAFWNFETSNPEEFESDYVLIGLRDDLSYKGYQQPSFKDYFALHTGDLLYWKEEATIYIPVMSQKTTYFIDTLQTVIYTDDTIQYITRRGEYDDVGEFVNSYDHTETFLLAREGQLLEAHAGWFERPGIPFGFEPHYGIKPFTLQIEAGDTMTSNCFESAFYDLSEFDCTIQPYFDNWETYCYSTPIGLTSIEAGGIGGHYNLYLIGSIINGIPKGVVEIPTATSEISLQEEIVYPNPVTDILNIPENTESIRIFNLHGGLMQSQTNDTTIDVSDFAPGIYILQLTNHDGSVLITRVVKQ